MIVKLILKNYTPLYKKNVTQVELTTKEIFNIILGRNGFGKTSLMRELTPFPPDNADYQQGGYKEIHLVIGKDTFILKSSTGKSSEHHFIHNGKNLNEGNTLLVQKELVKIHFGITQNTKNIITGLDVRDLFTTLSAARRKDFLMSVNPNDTSYALKMFDKLKANHNAIKGGLKTQRQRLVVEEARLVQMASMEPEKLQQEIRVMDDQIKNALIIHGTLQSIERQDITPLRTEIGNIISFLMSVNTTVKHTEPTLRRMLEQLYGTLDHHKTREIKYSTMLTEFATQLSGLDSANANLEGYKARLVNIELAYQENHARFNQLKDKFNKNAELFTPWSLDETGFGNFAQVAMNLVYQIQQVNRAVDNEITSGKYQRNQNLLREKSIERDNLKRKMDEIAHTLNHYQRADSIDCPKCEHKFKPGFTEVNPQKLRTQLEDLNGAFTRLSAEVNELDDYITDNQGWFDSMSDLLRFARNTDSAEVIIKLFLNYRIGKTDTSVLVDLIKSTVMYVEVGKTFAVLEEEKQAVEKQIVFLETSDIETLFQRCEYVERELASTQRSVARILRDIQGINQQLETIQLDQQRRDRLEYLMGEIEDAVTKNGQFKIKQRVEELINELSPRKDQLIANLIRSESLNSVIQSIKDNIADLEKREKHTLLLLDGLSPVKGLIGYLMNDFLKSVVANVNAIIQPIWTNRLHVLNCSTSKSEEDVDLNYAFPVMSGGSDKPNKDIGDCSGGERDIINFAFRLVLLRYLGASSGLPFMMDEIGSAFDELHRGRFAAYIAEQFRLDKLPQVFMISHNYKEYAGKTNANYIALNVEGIRLGFEVNQNSAFR